jgi:hypothetical protein
MAGSIAALQAKLPLKFAPGMAITGVRRESRTIVYTMDFQLPSDGLVVAQSGGHSARVVAPRLRRQRQLASSPLVRASAVKPISASALKADFVNAEQVAAIGQEETSGALLIERAPDPETDDAVPIAGCSTAMTSRAHLVRNAGPGTAAEAMAAAIAGHPRRSVGRCAPVILV